MIEFTILGDDGTMFIVALPRDEFSAAEALDDVWEKLRMNEQLWGRFASNGVPQEQFRLCRFYERGVRAVFVDFEQG